MIHRSVTRSSGLSLSRRLPLFGVALLGATGCGSSPSTEAATGTARSELSSAAPTKQVHRGTRSAPQHAIVRTLDEITAADKARVPSRLKVAPAVLPERLSARSANGSATPLGGAAAPSASPLSGAPSPAPAASFLAAESSGWIPPDTNGAVGPNHLVVAENGRVRFQSRDGATLNDFTLEGFFSSVDSTGFIFDPHVTFDPLGNRFVIIALDNEDPSTSAVVIAVSHTSDPTNGWSFFGLHSDPNNLGWADFPKLGWNGRWVVISANLIGGPDSAFVFACDKAALYAGTASCARFVIPDFSAPAVVYDASVSTEYIAHNQSPFSAGTVAIDTITGPVGAEVFTENAGTITLPATWSTFGPNAPQSDIPDLIETDFEAGVASFVYRNGSLWGTQTAYLPTESPTHSAVQWWQVSPSGVVQQFARIEDPNGQTFFAYPSLAVNANEDMLIGYARFSAAQHPSGNYAFRAGTDAPNTLRSDTVLKAGESSYAVYFQGRNRWGDYSATQVDPVNDLDLWTIQEYAASPANTWGTWWGKIVPSASTGCTEDTAIDLGAPDSAVTVPNDGCVRVRDAYPSWWGTRSMRLETMSPGTYPVPFTWSNACASGQGNGAFTGDFQRQDFGPTSSACATLIDLQGDGSGTIVLRYFGI